MPLCTIPDLTPFAFFRCEIHHSERQCPFHRGTFEPVNVFLYFILLGSRIKKINLKCYVRPALPHRLFHYRRAYPIRIYAIVSYQKLFVSEYFEISL